ncbi:MAG: extracellular solute-binding protein [Minwuia sp.]|nr:extracellular solute-binding protein [Minwuia sp.]
MKDLSIKTLGAVTMVAASMALVAPAMADGKFDGVTLRIATWGGSNKAAIESTLVPKFEALGGEIEFVTGSPQANFAKLIAARGRAPFDVMEILDAQLPDFAKTDYLAKIDLSKVPNTKDVPDWSYNEMGMASWITQETICYDTEKFADLGISAPTTYKDLAVPALEGRLSIPDITSGGGLANFAAISYAAGGDLKNVQPGLDLIKELNVLKFWSRGGETVTQFGTGDIYAAIVHAGWCVRAKKAGHPVQTVHPVIGDMAVGVQKYGRLGIMKSSKNYEAALWYVNEFIGFDNQFALATNTGVFPTNIKVAAKLADDPVLKQMLALDPAETGKQLRIDYTDADISAWVDQWTRAIVTN